MSDVVEVPGTEFDPVDAEVYGPVEDLLAEGSANAGSAGRRYDNDLIQLHERSSVDQCVVWSFMPDTNRVADKNAVDVLCNEHRR